MNAALPAFWPEAPYFETLPVERVQPGRQVTLDLNGINNTSHGRIAHLSYIMLTFVVSLDTVAASMAEALPVRLQRLILQNLHVTAAGRPWFKNVDGVDLEDYAEVLRGAPDYLATFGSAVPDADGTGVSRTINVVIPFMGNPLSGDEREDRQLPLALFQGSRADRGQIQFNVASTLAAGVTVASVTSCTVYYGLTYRDRWMQPTPYQLHVVETSELKLNYPSEGAVDMLMVSNRGTTAANRAHADYVLDNAHINGQRMFQNANITAAQLGSFSYHQRRGFGENTIDVTSGETLTVFRGPAFDRRASKMPRGNIRLQWASRPSHFTGERYLIFDTGMHTDSANAAYARALGAQGEITTRSRGADNFLSALVAQELSFDGPGVPEVARLKA